MASIVLRALRPPVFFYSSLPTQSSVLSRIAVLRGRTKGENVVYDVSCENCLVVVAHFFSSRENPTTL